MLVDDTGAEHVAGVAGGAELIESGLGAGLVVGVVEGDLRAGAAEGHGLAEAGAAAGDEGDAPAEVEVG